MNYMCKDTAKIMSVFRILLIIDKSGENKRGRGYEEGVGFVRELVLTAFPHQGQTQREKWPFREQNAARDHTQDVTPLPKFRAGGASGERGQDA